MFNFDNILKNTIESYKLGIINNNYVNKINCLYIMTVENKPGLAYYNALKKACNQCGINIALKIIKPNKTIEDIKKYIKLTGRNKLISGIIVDNKFSAIWDDEDIESVLSAISIDKDIDFCSPKATSRLFRYLNNNRWGCIGTGLYSLFTQYGIKFNGKKVVVLGRGKVGQSVTNFFLRRDNFVQNLSACTEDNILKKTCQEADILIVASDRTNFITKDFIKQGAIVLDVTTENINGKIQGGVNYEDCKEKASYITKSPLDFGKLTVAGFIVNAYDLYENLYGDLHEDLNE